MTIIPRTHRPRLFAALLLLVFLAAALGPLAMGTRAQGNGDDQAVQQLMDDFSYEALEAAPVQEPLEAPLWGGNATVELDRVQLEQYHTWRMEQERTKIFHVSILSALTFAALIFVVYMITLKTNYTASNILNVTGLILIIYGTLVLTLMAETEQQLTAAMGILGAVAGYLFGTMKREPESGKPDGGPKSSD